MPEDAPPVSNAFPLELQGLARAMSGGAVQVQCRVPDALNVDPSSAVCGACRRICEEALSNAVRHARALRIVLEVATPQERLVLRILDDGIGFDHSALGGGGFARMEELARCAGGRLDVRSAPFAGTCVSATFSLVE